MHKLVYLLHAIHWLAGPVSFSLLRARVRGRLHVAVIGWSAAAAAKLMHAQATDTGHRWKHARRKGNA